MAAQCVASLDLLRSVQCGAVQFGAAYLLFFFFDHHTQSSGLSRWSGSSTRLLILRASACSFSASACLPWPRCVITRLSVALSVSGWSSPSIRLRTVGTSSCSSSACQSALLAVRGCKVACGGAERVRVALPHFSSCSSSSSSLRDATLTHHARVRPSNAAAPHPPACARPASSAASGTCGCSTMPALFHISSTDCSLCLTVCTRAHVHLYMRRLCHDRARLQTLAPPWHCCSPPRLTAWEAERVDAQLHAPPAYKTSELEMTLPADVLTCVRAPASCAGCWRNRPCPCLRRSLLNRAAGPWLNANIA